MTPQSLIYNKIFSFSPSITGTTSFFSSTFLTPLHTHTHTHIHMIVQLPHRAHTTNTCTKHVAYINYLNNSQSCMTRMQVRPAAQYLRKYYFPARKARRIYGWSHRRRSRGRARRDFPYTAGQRHCSERGGCLGNVWQRRSCGSWAGRA
jgi:hypothetical protein